MSEFLSASIFEGDWEFFVDTLFGPNPLFPEYYQACIKKDLEKAQKCISEGAFAENTYLWNQKIYTCIMDCCESIDIRHGRCDELSVPVHDLFFFANESDIHKLAFAFGLLDIHSLSDDYIHNFFAVPEEYTCLHRVLIENLPSSRLATIRGAYGGGSLLHAMLGYGSNRNVTEMAYLLLKHAPEINLYELDDCRGETFLYGAIEKLYTSFVEDMLKKGGFDVNEKDAQENISAPSMVLKYSTEYDFHKVKELFAVLMKYGLYLDLKKIDLEKKFKNGFTVGDLLEQLKIK
jgi:hypothetical protein